MTTQKNKIAVGALVALLVVGTSMMALAEGPRGGGRGHGQGQGGGHGEFGPEMRIERMAKRLDLSEDQIASIKEIRENGRSDSQELRKQMLRLRNEKQGEMLKDDPSTKKVLALTTELGDLRTKMQTNRMANRLEVRKVLTPEQRDKMLLAGKDRGKKGRGHKGGQKRGGGRDECSEKGGRQSGCGQQGQGSCENDGRGPHRGNK